MRLSEILRMRTPAYIYVDLTNIYVSGREHAARARGEDPNLWRLHFHNFAYMLSHRRQVVRRVWCVSTPNGVRNSLVFAIERTIGVTPLIVPSRNGKEHEIVDLRLQVEILHDLHEHAEEPVAFVLCTGDGAGFRDGSGFLLEAKRAIDWGWQLEVFAWEHSCNRRLRALAEREGAFHPLEKHYDHISYIEGGRRARPFSDDDI